MIIFPLITYSAKNLYTNYNRVSHYNYKSLIFILPMKQSSQSRLTDEERMAMVRNARKEEETEAIERSKYEARSAIGEIYS